MTAVKPGPQILEVPGNPTLWRTADLPPTRIEVPCAGRVPQMTMLLTLLVMGPMVIAAWVVVLVALVRVALELDGDPFKTIRLFLALLIFLPVLFIGSEAVLITLRGIFHRGHHAGFDAEKLWHFQLSEPIAFRNIKRFEAFYVGRFLVALRITVDQPFRLRFPSIFNWRRSSRRAGAARFTFSSRMIGNNSTLLTNAIGHLVKSNGGTIARRKHILLLLDIVLPWLR